MLVMHEVGSQGRRVREEGGGGFSQPAGYREEHHNKLPSLPDDRCCEHVV